MAIEPNSHKARWATYNWTNELYSVVVVVFLTSLLSEILFF